MSLQVGSLYASLTASTSGWNKAMEGALKTAEKFAKDMKRLSGEIASAGAAITAVGAAAVAMAQAVDGPTKQAMDGLHKSTQLLAVQVADMLLPAIRSLAEMMKTAAGVVAGLSPHTKEMISTFAVIAVQVAVAAKAFSVFSSLAGSVIGLSRALLAVAAPLAGIALAVGAVVAVVILLHRAWRKNWGGIQEATQSVLEWLRSGFGQLANFMGGLWNFMVDGAAKFIDGLLKVGEAIERITGKKLGVAGMREGFAGLWKDLKSGSFFSGAFEFGKSLGAQIGTAASEELSLIMSELGFDKLLSQGKTIGLGRGMGPKSPITSGAAAGPGLEAMRAAKAMEALRRAVDLDVASVERHEASLIDAERGVKKWLSSLDAGPAASGVAIGRLGMNTSTALGMGGGGAIGEQRRQEDERNMSAEEKKKKAWSDATNADSWGEAQKILNKGLSGATNFGTTLELWGRRMGPQLAAAGKQILGAVGELVGSIVEGAKSGGVWGAIIAMFLEIVKKTASALEFLGIAMEFVEQIAAMVEPLVAPIFEALTNVLGVVTQIVAPVFEALGPLFKAIFALIESLYPVLYSIGDVLAALSPIIELIGNVVGIIFKSLEPVFAIISGVLKVVATVILGIIIFLNEIAAALGDTAARDEAERLKKKVDKMWTMDADASARAAGATLDNAAAQEKAAEAASKVAASLSNVPSGYKIALARMNADMGITGTAYGGGGGGTTVNIYGDITTDSSTVEALAEDAKKEAARERGQQRGTGAPPRGRGGRD
jgi:hypothetical protein